MKDSLERVEGTLEECEKEKSAMRALRFGASQRTDERCRDVVAERPGDPKVAPSLGAARALALA
jgi:hypothetical protein